MKYKCFLCNKICNIYWTKKKVIVLVMLPFSVHSESGYMEYEILLTAIFHIGLCNKFRNQSSVKGLSRQWVEFQKVRAGRILTTKINICVDRRCLYFFPDRKSTKFWTHSCALEHNSVQKVLGFVMTGRWKRKPRWNFVYPSSTCNSPHNMILEEFQSCYWQKYRF